MFSSASCTNRILHFSSQKRQSLQGSLRHELQRGMNHHLRCGVKYARECAQMQFAANSLCGGTLSFGPHRRQHPSHHDNRAVPPQKLKVMPAPTKYMTEEERLEARRRARRAYYHRYVVVCLAIMHTRLQLCRHLESEQASSRNRQRRIRAAHARPAREELSAQQTLLPVTCAVRLSLRLRRVHSADDDVLKMQLSFWGLVCSSTMTPISGRCQTRSSRIYVRGTGLWTSARSAKPSLAGSFVKSIVRRPQPVCAVAWRSSDSMRSLSRPWLRPGLAPPGYCPETTASHTVACRTSSAARAACSLSLMSSRCLRHWETGRCGACSRQDIYNSSVAKYNAPTNQLLPHPHPSCESWRIQIISPCSHSAQETHTA